VHLKSLVLKGFKSFADRSVLVFEPGITAVVGPNGSGKSNISDAVLWVLGERSAKNLRGSIMEDVIFSGSSARKPVGIAEVDLILDNSDSTLPVEFSEVVITRRMYRSGESEYLINGTIVRRMDILDILHDTGLGSGTNSIISQGSLELILHSKPEERRTLIEDAAGVLKHKQRKQRSERKLEQMDIHLTRVRDISAEIERQLRPLERKAKRAQSYQGLASELTRLSLLIAVDDLRVLQEKWRLAGESEAHHSARLELAREAINRAEEHAGALQEQVAEQSQSAGEVARQFRRAQSALERFDATRMLLYEKKRIAQTYETDIVLGLETNAERQGLAQAEAQLTRARIDEMRSELAGAREAVLQLQNTQAGKLATRSNLERELEAFREAEAKCSLEMEAIREAQAQNLELLSTSKASEKLLGERSLELQAQIDKAKADFEEASLRLEEQETSLGGLVGREAAAREELAASFSARERARHVLESLQEEAAVAGAQIKALEERQRLSIAPNQALEWLLENAASFAPGIERLSGLISTQPEYEPLVEAVLGKDLDGLCISDPQSAIQIAERLCAQGLHGEISLISSPALPVNSLKDREPVSERETSAAKARLSLLGGTALISFIECPESQLPLLEALLGDVYICDDIASAMSAFSASGGCFRFATKEGFMVWPSGKISLALGAKSEDGGLALQRQLKELCKNHERVEAGRAAATSAKEAADKALQDAQSASLMLSSQLAQSQGAFLAAQDELRHFEAQLESLNTSFAAMAHQRALAQQALEAASPTSREYELRLKELGAALEQTKAQGIVAQKGLLPLREEIKAQDDELAAARLKVATLTERENYAQRMLATKEQEIRSFAIEDEVARATLATKSVVKERAQSLLALIEALCDSVGSWTQRLESATDEETSMAAGLHAKISEARADSRAAYDAFDKTNELLSEAKVEKGRLEIQVDTAVKTIIHDCKIPLEAALASPVLEDRAQTENQVFKLRRRIANMGTINPDAAVEYEELKSRFDYMAGQLADMMAARRALAKIVRVIDARMKEGFITTFEKVNENFKEIFSILFPGGAAELKFVDPDDLENTGIEVTAQPRGKRITKMMLLSGGEKSLTALALLFAVYRIRSTPFYVLDEVEAALDDMNLRRVCAYFDSLRQTTQLILITHQRRTMEIADVLYGVSMQADGVTRVVSQKLDRALQSLGE